MSRLQRLMLLQGAALTVVVMMTASAGAQPSAVPQADLPGTVSAADMAKGRQKGDSASAQRAEVQTVRNSDGTQRTISLPAAAGSVEVPVTSGSFAFAGTAGDYVSQGKSYSYTSPTDKFNWQTSIGYAGESWVQFSVRFAANGDWWHLTLEAPNGADLAVGRYDVTSDAIGATDSDLFGNGRSCLDNRGYFEVHQIVLRADRTVEAIDATFVQRCSYATAFSYGHLLVNATALPRTPTTVSFDAAAQGTIDSRRTHSGSRSETNVDGQITCTGTVNVVVGGSLTQTINGGNVTQQAQSNTEMCAPGRPATWRVVSSSFQSGAAQAQAAVTVYDPYMVTAVESPALNDNTTLVARTVPVQTTLTSASVRLGGDYWKLGRSGHRYTNAADQIEAWSDGTYLYLSVAGVDGKKWNIYLATVGSNKFAVGKYPNVTWFNTASLRNNANAPSLLLLSEPNGCGTATGSFEVHQVAYQPDGSLSGLDATFEHHCSGEAPAAYGHVLLNMTPLRELPTLSGDLYGFNGFSKRTAYGVNNGGSMYGEVTCSVADKLSITGYVLQGGDVKIPLKMTIDCVPGDEVAWRIFGTALGTSTLVVGEAASEIAIVPSDPYLAAYRVSVRNQVTVWMDF